MTTTGRIALALVALALCIGVTACGGGDEEAGTTTEETTNGDTSPAGREIFVANCASCHALSDAGATGAIGPSLDESTADQSAIEQQVRTGGGGMPAFEGQLSDEEITEVSAYVVAARQG